MVAAAQQEKQFSIPPGIFLSSFSRASKLHLFLDSAQKMLLRGKLLSLTGYLIIWYTNDPPWGKVTFEARDQCGVPGDSSWPPGSQNMGGILDFRTWSAWEAPTGTWRTWARTTPGIDFWAKFKKHKLLGMIKWVDFRCFWSPWSFWEPLKRSQSERRAALRVYKTTPSIGELPNLLFQLNITFRVQSHQMKPDTTKNLKMCAAVSSVS